MKKNIMICDWCGKEVELSPDERSVFLWVTRSGIRESFDVCEECVKEWQRKKQEKR